eukprot:COSAG01_NODE_476_length_16515_cov_37.730690_5_plen_209_part_00
MAATTFQRHLAPHPWRAMILAARSVRPPRRALGGCLSRAAHSGGISQHRHRHHRWGGWRDKDRLGAVGGRQHAAPVRTLSNAPPGHTKPLRRGRAGGWGAEEEASAAAAAAASHGLGGPGRHEDDHDERRRGGRAQRRGGRGTSHRGRRGTLSPRPAACLEESLAELHAAAAASRPHKRAPMAAARKLSGKVAYTLRQLRAGDRTPCE